MNEYTEHTELLIQYLDGELRDEQLTTLQKSIEENPALHAELESLRLTKESIKIYGLKTRISSIHTGMMNELKGKNSSKPGLVKMIFQYSFRVAAVLIVLFGISAVYQYYSVTPEKLFDENYHAYEIRETRGSAGTALEDLYEKGDMNALIRKFDLIKSPEPKDFMLAGNAFLRIHQPAKAIQAFTGLETYNLKNGTHFYEEENEYFLALSYLSNHEPAIALPVFEKIHADPNHPFYPAVNTWFLAKVRKLSKEGR